MISFVANNNMYIHVKSALIYIKCLLCVSSLGGPTFISLSCEVSVFIISSHSSKRIPYSDFVIVRKRQCAKVKKQECSHIAHIISIKKKLLYRSCFTMHPKKSKIWPTTLCISFNIDVVPEEQTVFNSK